MVLIVHFEFAIQFKCDCVCIVLFAVLESWAISLIVGCSVLAVFLMITLPLTVYCCCRKKVKGAQHPHANYAPLSDDSSQHQVAPLDSNNLRGPAPQNKQMTSPGQAAPTIPFTPPSGVPPPNLILPTVQPVTYNAPVYTVFSAPTGTILLPTGGTAFIMPGTQPVGTMGPLQATTFYFDKGNTTNA